MSKPTLAITLGTQTFTAEAPIQGVRITTRGNKASQSAHVTLENDGTRWSTQFPTYGPVDISIDGTQVFEGFIERLSTSNDYPGSITVECAGHSKELSLSDIRPLIYDSDAAANERDGDGVTVTVSGGEVSLPQDAKHIPIYQLFSVQDSNGDPINVLNIDKGTGVIFVDPKHNGAVVKVNYTVFKEKYEAEAASAILQDLFDRHAISHITGASIPTIATTLTFEPKAGNTLMQEWGRIRDFLGSDWDFYVSSTHVATFVQRNAASSLTINADTAAGRAALGIRSTSFSVDGLAYANVVTARSAEGQTNSITQDLGVFKHRVEGLNPSGTQVDAVAQGFKALGEGLESFQFKGLRETRDDALSWAIEYNGKREAIAHDFDSLQAATPDSDNVEIDTATSSIHVETNGTGTAYFSMEWIEDLTQDVDGSVASTTTNDYQSITVADLTRTTIKGFVFKSDSTTGEVKFEIRSGAGAGGTLLGTSETIDLASPPGTKPNWFPLYFADAVDVSGETTISFVKVNVSGTPRWEHDNGADSYAGGVSSVGAGTDFTWQVISKVTIQDAIEGFAKFTDDVTATNATPTYFIARDYIIGSPDTANWVQVLNNAPRLMTDGTTADRFGIKVVFNSASTTTDPLLTEIRGSVAYSEPNEALDQPSGITVGDQSGTVSADDLPFFNPVTGSFTADVSANNTRLERNGNYWLTLTDGNQANSISYFTAFYDDGADGTLAETWDDATNVASESNTDIADGAISLDRWEPTGSYTTGDLITAGATITDALLVPTNVPAAGSRHLQMVSRNHRNYYYPGRSTDTSNPPLLTGELCVHQFDDGDSLGNTTPGLATWADVSGNGFSLNTAKGTGTTAKYGGNVPTFNAVVAAGTSSSGMGPSLLGDFAVAVWYNPDSLGDDEVFWFLGNSGAAAATHTLKIKQMASGAVRLTHTYDNDAASVETFTSTGTPLSAGTWTHVAVTRDVTAKQYRIYLNGALDSTHTYTNAPDERNDKVGIFPHSNERADGYIDDHRIWAHIPDIEILNLVKDYPYDAGISSKFTFPSEADGTDDYTTGDAADASKDDLRIRGFLLSSPFFDESVSFYAPLSTMMTSTANIAPNSDIDLSSYAHQPDSTLGANTAMVNGGPFATWADFNGTTSIVAAQSSDNIRPGDVWSLLWHMQHDVTGNLDTLFHKRGELKVECNATSSTLSNIFVTINVAGGGTRTHTFTGVSLGTAQKHVALTYDGQTLTLYINGVSAGPNDFGSFKQSAETTNSFAIGATDVDGTAGNATAFYDGKMAQVILLSHVATAAEIDDFRLDPTSGRRPPTQSGYTAAAYSSTGSKIYTAGKYLVTRDDGDTWVDTLDGTNSNANGSLAFKMAFSREGLYCTRKDQTEINRVGFEARKTIEVPAKDIETLCSFAEGYLSLLKDGLEKGVIAMDGRVTPTVGDIVTITDTHKGQSAKDYAVASVTHDITPGDDWKTTFEFGEEERDLVLALKGQEVGL